MTNNKGRGLIFAKNSIGAWSTVVIAGYWNNFFYDAHVNAKAPLNGKKLTRKRVRFSRRLVPCLHFKTSNLIVNE